MGALMSPSSSAAPENHQPELPILPHTIYKDMPYVPDACKTTTQPYHSTEHIRPAIKPPNLSSPIPITPILSLRKAFRLWPVASRNAYGLRSTPAAPHSTAIRLTLGKPPVSSVVV
ncbi:hypothetical protein BJY04DRAFT_88441 [Aspergillus karnatakaensis]|uniref:uncharacterized protein n=1 Tax=Aspergillus karnatakaensis TaxID=1810916 RepID=UPI003CCD52D0